MWTGLGFAIALPVVYFPALTILATHTRSSFAGVLQRAAVCAMLGIAPAVFLAGWLGARDAKGILFFWAIFAIDGVVLAVGHWLISRDLEAY